MFLSRILLIAVAILVCSASSITKGQDQKRNASTDAQIVFDFSVDALLKMPEFNSVSIEKLIKLDSQDSPFGPDFQVSDIARVSGAISLPNRVGDFAKVFYEDQFPFDFILQIQFLNEVHAEQLTGYLAKQDFSSETLGEATLTRIPITDMKTSVLIRRLGKSSFLIGTKGFLSGTINDVVSPIARKAWVKCGKGPVRFVFDLKNAPQIVDEIFQIADFGDAQQQLEKVTEQANAFSVSLLPDSGELLQIGVSSNNAESTLVLKKRLDFLSFELGTEINRLLMPLCKKGDSEPVAIDGLSTDVSGSEVSLRVARPKDFGSMVQRAFAGPDIDAETVEADKGQPVKQLTKR